MRRALRWIKRIVLGGLALVIVLVGVALAVVHTDWGRDKIRAAIVDGLQGKFPGSTIGSLSGSPFGTIVVRDINLMARDHRPVATIAELRLRVSLRPLLSKRVQVDELHVSGVEVYVREGIAPPPSEPSAFSIDLLDVTVDGARVTLESATGVEVIDQLRVQAAVKLPADQSVSANANVRGTWRGKPLAIRALALVEGTTTVIPFASIQLGDASVVANGVELRTTSVAGSVSADVPAALVQELANVRLPGDIVLAAHAQHSGAVKLAATSGPARVRGDVLVELGTKRARGIISAEATDLAALTRGKVTGAGTVVAALSADDKRARGFVTIAGTIEGRTGTTTIAIDATETHAELVASAEANEGTAAIHAIADRNGEAWTLAESSVRARVHDVEGVRHAQVALSARGPLWPVPELTIAGTVDATGYHKRQTSVGSVHAELRGIATKERQRVTVSATATEIVSGTTRIPSASLSADADVTEGLIALELGEHAVETADGAKWAGRGGRVTVTAKAIVVDNLRTGTGASRVIASARIGRLDNSLSAKVSARDVSLAMADPTLRGTADADIDVTRRGRSWRGGASVKARGVTVPGQPTVDANVDVTLAGRKITVDATVSNPQLGTTTVAAEVTGPADITSTDAWKALPRTAIDKLEVAITGFDATAVGGTGTASGQLVLGPTDARGTFDVRGVMTKGGPVDATITIASKTPDTFDVHASATIAGLPTSTADASIVLPARPFDPVAWKQLGKRALKGATIQTGTIRVDPALLARFGFVTPYSADVSATITVEEALKSIAVSADVRGLSGGNLITPIDIDLDGAADATGLHADMRATSGSVTATVSAKSPISLERALDPKAPPMPIDVTVTIPDTRAPDLLAMLGQTDVLAGIVGGTVTVTGTVAAPVVRAKLFARGFAMKTSSVTNKKPLTLESLELTARYSHDHAEVKLLGSEGKDRLLQISASGNPRDPRSMVASIEAANFDLTPLAAFGTGPVRGARGTLSGALKIKGLDPRTGSIRGQLMIRDGRFPLTPTLGNLRRASLTIDAVGHKLIATFDGRVGAGGGTISGKVTSDLDGGMPRNAHLTMKVKRVMPIGALQPQVDADIEGDWVNQGDAWSGKLTISNGKIVVPPESGHDLLETGAPPDMIFVDKQLAKKTRKEPTRTWLTTTIVLRDTDVDLQDEDARVRLTARGRLVLQIGNGIALKGQITTVTGIAEVVGRRYRIEQGTITYDGPPDPRLDIRVVHDFKNLTLSVEVTGRASKPDVRLRGDRGLYTEGQLWSFLLGGEPTDQDSASQAGQAVVSGGLAILSGRVGRKVNKYLPLKFDSINYEAETATSSKAVRFGLQLSEKSYLVWRQRLAARPDENAGEAVIEYQFRPNFLFEGTIGERNKGGDFLWRKRW